MDDTLKLSLPFTRTFRLCRPPVAEAELRPPRTPPRPRTPTRTVPPLAASERQRAESKRRSARDEWNVQEILLDWAISRHPGRQVRQRFDLPAPLADEAEFRHYFNLIFPSLEIQLWDDNEEDQEPAAQQLLMAFRSADRDGDGFVSVRDVENYTMGYNVLTVTSLKEVGGTGTHVVKNDKQFSNLQGYQCLTTNAVRQLAFTPLTAERLQDLMESLNEGFVSAAEVKGVLLEAQLIGEGRQALLWALGSWYVNVQRAETPWLQVLRAAVRRWIPSEEEHHGWMLHDLARMTMDLPKTLPLPKRLGGRPDSTSRASQAVHPTWGRRVKACILTLAVLIHIFYLCLLVFPAVLFGLMIYLGSEHGDDRCPKDLDALLVWFGALGAASLVMDCANDGKLAISFITWALKISLALMPFLGMAWTHSLQHRDAEMCGPFVFWTSKWIWSALASCELYVLCLLSWSFHVARNHERSLRRAAVSEDENQCPAVSDALLS
ncbi:EF-hand domain-containing protein [Durusdinium trenchii]|uniref:EF-hand domain-containing protein n=1 Tax=Durusdinium trenchii TaxID=1381693 RepID=A0ABP0KY94_9DINO